MNKPTTSSEPLNFVHRFVPAPAGGSAPVLLLLHGTGGSENDLLDLGHSLLPGAALLSPRGKILENGMPRFFRRLAEGVFDEEDLIHRTHELSDFLEAAAKRYAFDPSKVIAAGYSNGANIAASMLLLRPGALRGAVLLRAMTPLIPEKLPDLTGVSVFLASGRNDPIVPTRDVEQLAAMLRKSKADVSLQWSAGGHQLTSPEIDAAREWLRKDQPSPTA
jgi:phospholipase/carboxylesterase